MSMEADVSEFDQWRALELRIAGGAAAVAVALLILLWYLI